MAGNTYSNPLRVTYGHGLLAFTAALTTLLNPPPQCRNGRVEDIHVRATIVFTNVTTAALVNVGTGASATKYAQLNLGALAAAATLNFTSTGGSSNFNPAAAVISSDINFDRDGITQVQLQVVPPTGGSPTGTGFLDVTLAWY